MWKAVNHMLVKHTYERPVVRTKRELYLVWTSLNNPKPSLVFNRSQGNVGKNKDENEGAKSSAEFEFLMAGGLRTFQPVNFGTKKVNENK